MPEPKTRVRAFSHRTRAGCLTCKTRRKKCDEQRPICNRCKVGGFICDGYEADGAGPKKKKHTPTTPDSVTYTSHTCSPALLASKRNSNTNNNNTRCLPILQPAPLRPQKLLLPGDARETQFYVYFFTDTIGDLVMSHAFSTTFWHQLLQPSSQHATCIRHAVIALGAVHWQFSRHEPPSSLNHFALKHYNEAISALVRAGQQQSSSPSSPADIATTVTCCFLFILLESLRGDYAEALRHLEAGTTILADHHPASYLPNRDMQELAAIFHAISGQVAVFTEERIFPDLSRFRSPMKKYPNRTEELRDIDEAEDVLNTLDDLLIYVTVDLPQDWDSPTSDCVMQWEIMRISVQRWKVQYDALVQRLTREGEYKANLERIVNLRVQYKMWEMLMDHDQDCEPPEMSPEECNELLDLLDQLWYSPSRAVFGLKTDLLTALYQLYVFCQDEATRTRIITMLRARRRREIIWDSSALADFLERHMQKTKASSQRLAGGAVAGVAVEKPKASDRWPDIGPSPAAEALVVFRPKRQVS
ncbi:uncharacterized protein B0I36DRAFT_296324 [Microdochium trichocladiopsis]|uniref:Zn(2)-C6 fungal-type domain-containing protein n=1 Tax=Microdochium trichocladiopsis TaxID=1682393 RepID=A0A9P9BKR1_9PEZI|nr:uncharacterized protein B0I36DRAFT_296324 [Microdochium trichocladiopsis]KAH7020862.1 hypothetical protein B0I36DRAFT_296324 [Microdochium trichocladiopsis]